MRRIVLFVLCLLMSAVCVAQPGAKSYAPEDLTGLSVNDRIRVLNNEYADLSGGQRLQRDQLEFYLDQIEQSDWGFTQIREDMQASLGDSEDYEGDYDGAQQGFPGGGGLAIECASIGNRYQECPSNFRFPELVEQLSRSECIPGQTWGVRGSVIWVNGGCRARFAEGRPPVAPIAGRTIQCSSIGQRQENCPTNSRWPMRLQRQLSSSACTEGYSWGNARGVVWVSRGCRGIFEEVVNAVPQPGIGGPAQLRCESTGSLRVCPWDSRVGRPALLREYSRGYCVQGRTWGVDQRGLWVTGGCAGLFGLR